VTRSITLNSAHATTTPSIFYRLILRSPSWACHRPRLFSSTHVCLKKKSKKRESSKTSKIKPLITRNASESSEVAAMAPVTTTGPYAEDSALIASLHALQAKSPKLVKSSVHPAPADPTIQIRSWKMNEFKYYDVPSPFPTLARGLFSREIPGDASRTYQVVVRGYDKFFNIGEVPWTTVCFFFPLPFYYFLYVIDCMFQWSSLETHTAAPYTLSLKSNGCIILIAALTPTTLLITSKHSLGSIEAKDVSHAQAGEAWLRKYLANKGKTEADLATRLWESNLTAIAEVISRYTYLQTCLIYQTVSSVM
jgi:RNA ligase